MKNQKQNGDDSVSIGRIRFEVSIPKARLRKNEILNLNANNNNQLAYAA